MTHDERDLRWARAAAWARGQSFGPGGQGVDADEADDIETLRDLITEMHGEHGEDDD